MIEGGQRRRVSSGRGATRRRDERGRGGMAGLAEEGSPCWSSSERAAGGRIGEEASLDRRRKAGKPESRKREDEGKGVGHDRCLAARR
jgi:hypothetical protein